MSHALSTSARERPTDLARASASDLAVSYMGELGALFFNAVADGGGALAGVSQRIAPGKLTTELMATFHSEETPMYLPEPGPVCPEMVDGLMDR
eukprot:753354-Rhodomonas_salina.1